MHSIINFKPAYAAPPGISPPVPAFTTVGDLFAALLPAILTGGGLLLFAYLLMGGFKYLTAGGDDKAIQEAKKMITNAVVGFIILFCSFWIMRIVEAVFKIDILGP